MAKRLFSLLLLLFFSHISIAQSNTDTYQMIGPKAKEKIIIDGDLNEAIWQSADKATNFIQNSPKDGAPATSETEVMMAFDDNNLYIAGTCYENSTSRHVVQSLKRDFNWGRNDNLMIYFDPYDDFTNGFGFGISPAGVQREGLVTNVQDFSTDWDNKWYSAVKDNGDSWHFEIAIPFKSIRFNPKIRHWNVVFLRQDVKNNEQSTWSPVPRGYRPSSFAFAGKLNFEEPLKKVTSNISVIPYTSFGANKDHEADSPSTDYDFDAGFDAKIGVSSSLNLDLTVNPDFSQVEVDQQVTDLSRFEIFFPEKRQFFLENIDLFGTNGFPQSRPFFSRRIGIVQRDGLTEQIPILYGARLSGKVGKKWRVGLMNMLTKKDQSFGLPSQNYTVGVLQRNVFSRSNISFSLVNKESLNIDLADTVSFDFHESILKERMEDTVAVPYLNSYNRVFGVDYNLFSPDGKWEGNAFYHRSLNPENESGAHSAGMFLGRSTKTSFVGGFVSSVGEGYMAEVGFVPRNDVIRIGLFTEYFFYPENGAVIRHGPDIDATHTTNQDFDKTDQNVDAAYEMRFANTSEIRAVTEYNYRLLRRPFAPNRVRPESLQSGTDYSWQTYGLGYTSNLRSRFVFEIKGNVGGFYNADRFNGKLKVRYRFPPLGSVSINLDYNKIEMPGGFTDAEFILVGTKLDLTFTDKLFFTTFVQYNDQIDNLNINARLQWRYQPASDFFLVYTDNYFPDDFGVKNRAIVLKLSYWLNI